MLPVFDPDGGLPLALVRGGAVAALLTVFGTLAFRVLVAPRALAAVPAAEADRVERHLATLTRLAIGAALLGGVAWLAMEAASMADAASLSQAAAAVPAVLAHTAYGHLMAVQLSLLVALGWMVAGRTGARRLAVELGLATLALALQAGHSHAASMIGGPSLLLAAEIVHLLGAGAWLGGLPPLLLVVACGGARAGAQAARGFSPLGQLCLVALTASALVQGWGLVQSIPGLVGTAYGWMVLVKLGLFGVLFGFALLNRYRLAPALRGADPAAATRRLVRSIALQTGFGLAIVAAAGILSALPPAMHEQPLWPFPEVFTWDTIAEDPAFRTEVIGAGLALAGAAVLLVLAAVLRRWARWAAALVAAAIAWFAVPHLDLLFVPAYPTSFYHSPTGFAAAAIVEGAALYPQHCAACHGTDGRGDGPAASTLPVPPANLTAEHLWMHADGELFWWLAHGIEGPEGGLAMPGFASVLSASQRWDLIDYLRAHNAGVAFAASGLWPVPVAAPEVQLRCEAGGAVDLASLHGGVVRLVIAAPTMAATAMPGVTTILATPDPALRPSPGLCLADDQALRGAYAIIAGLAPLELPGTEFLIDSEGWLRAVQPPAAAPGWDDPAVLHRELQQLADHPIPASPGGSHAHMQM